MAPFSGAVAAGAGGGGGECGGATVLVYFLDTDLPENSESDRTLTHFLYGGDSYYRICQEVVLGIGGMQLYKAETAGPVKDQKLTPRITQTAKVRDDGVHRVERDAGAQFEHVPLRLLHLLGGALDQHQPVRVGGQVPWRRR